MATILMTWELGMGLGHIAPLKPLAEEMLRRGHRVALTLRDLRRAELVFGALPITYYQAPFRIRREETSSPPAAYVHLLENIGFGEPEGLAQRVSDWRRIFDETRPDLLLCEHSPTALLAARGYSFPRIVFGNGFFCPPGVETLPVLRPWLETPFDRIRSDEDRVTAGLNRVLQPLGGASLRVLPDLYREVDETLITTFAELDHFERPQPCEYHGIWSLGSGESFEWPPGDGPRVFAYLKPVPAVAEALRLLAIWRFPTIVYGDGLDGNLEQQYSGVSLRFVRNLLDMAQIGAECDVGVLNANHSTTAAFLRAGKPLLLLPLTLEHGLLARRLEAQGLAVAVPYNRAGSMEAMLRTVFDSDRYRLAARRFAEHYANFDPAQAVATIATRIEQKISAC